MLRLTNCVAALAFLLSVSLASPVRAEEPKIESGVMKVHQLNGYGKKLWVEGSLVDENGKDWKFTIVPGHKNIWQLAIWGWSEAKGQMVQLFRKDLYVEKMGKELQNGSDMVYGGLKFAWKDGVKGYWLEELPKDFMDIGRDVRGAYRNGNPGWLVASAWSVVSGLGECAWDGVAGAGVCVGGVAYTAVGGLRTILGPALVWAARPVTAILAAAIPGTLVPGVAYVWNGFSWVAINGEAVLSGRQVKGQSWWFYVPGQYDEREARLLSTNALDTIVEASLLQALSAPQRAKIEASAKAMDPKIQAAEEEERKTLARLQTLRDEKANLMKEYYRQQNEENKTAAVSKLNQLISSSWEFTSTDFDANTHAILVDNAKLRALVEKVGKSTNLNLTNEQIDQILVRIQANVKAIKQVR